MNSTNIMAFDKNNTFFGYPVNIFPEENEIDLFYAVFTSGKKGPEAAIYKIGENGRQIPIERFCGPELGSFFDKIAGYARKKGNHEYIERELLHAILCQIHGVEYIPDEDCGDFQKRIALRERRSWKYTG